MKGSYETILFRGINSESELQQSSVGTLFAYIELKLSNPFERATLKHADIGLKRHLCLL